MATNQVEEQLECPICLDRFETPKLLPCQHTFCLRCLEQITEHGRMLRCPECRANHSVPGNGVSGFPTNITIQRLLEAINPPNVPSSSNWRDGRNTNRATDYHQNTFGHQSDATRRDTAGELRSNRRWDTRAGVVISPPVIPFHYPAPVNLEQTQAREDVEFQLALEMSAEDARTRRRSNRENGNTPVIFKNIRKTLRHLAGKILNNHKTLLSAFIGIFSVVTFSRFVAGAVKLSSDCPLERRAAAYLFVKACLASLFWGVLVVWSFKRNLEKAFDNVFVEVYLVIESLFSICWLFVGTAWITGSFYSINNQCPAYGLNWNGHFINFALFLTVIDYIGLVVFLFYSGYTICDSEEDSLSQNA